jgi:BRCA1-associated protein
LSCSKLDALATEYNHLLVTQLESQRQYFEGLLARQRVEAEADVDAAVAASSAAAAERDASLGAAAEADRRRRQADSKLVSAWEAGHFRPSSASPATTMDQCPR